MSKKGSSKGKKALAVILIVLVALAAIVFVGARIYFRAPVSDYYKHSEKEFVIPGLLNNLVPQGLDYVEDEQTYLVGGYQKDGSPSRVYRVDKNTGKTNGYVVLGDADGNGVAPHAGGLAAHGKYLFVAGDADACLYVYELSDVLSADSGETVRMVEKFPTKFGNDEINVAFVCFSDEGLIVGEFYRVPNYVTPDSHIVNTSTGEENHALALCYRFSNSKTSICGIETTPFKAYSLPGLVQGMAVKDGIIWLSQSYGTATSTISCYTLTNTDPVLAWSFYYRSEDREESLYLPVYALDSGTRISSFDAPPMAEEIIFVDDRMLIMSESASNKYFFGNLTGGRWCYATDVYQLT